MGDVGEAETDTVLFEYKLPGSGVRVYANRVETWRRGVFGTKRETILLRAVTAVEKGLSGKVTVRTADGKKHELVAGFQADKLRDVLLAHL
jgi:hypothetical protein